MKVITRKLKYFVFSVNTDESTLQKNNGNIF